MQDIRDDLQERADFCHDQIRAVCNHFDKMVQQLQSDRDTRVADLKATLTAVEKLMEYENGFMGNVVPLENPPSQRPSLADRIKAASA